MKKDRYNDMINVAISLPQENLSNKDWLSIKVTAFTGAATAFALFVVIFNFDTNVETFDAEIETFYIVDNYLTLEEF